MSTLIAIAYPDVATATQVRDTLADAMKEHIIELEDAVVVTRDSDGKIKLHQAVNTTATGAAGGALWGGLIGLIFLVPLLGMAVGAASGAAAGALSDAGVDDKFVKELGGGVIRQPQDLGTRAAYAHALNSVMSGASLPPTRGELLPLR